MKGRKELAAAAANAIDEERLVRLTRDLVAIRSVYEEGVEGANESGAALFVARTLRDAGFEVTVEEASPGRPNVIADWSGTGFVAGRHRTLMFEGHTDVVTEGDPASWTHPPFAAVLEDGRIYGRGSADMKGGVAAAIVAAEAVRKAAPDLPGRIRLGIVVDEEGMMTGIKDFIRRGWAAEVDAAIVCEPEENELCLFQKGALRVGVTFRGVMSHGAMPYAGVNAVPALARFVTLLGEYQAQEQERLGEHEHLGLPWLTPTVIRSPREGEQQLNVMPETAWVALDVRTVPGQEHPEIIARLEELAREAAGANENLSAELQVIEERPWTETSADEPIVKALERAHAHLGRGPLYGGVPGATDGTFLHAWAGVPVVTVGPGDRTIPHQKDEYVEVAALVESARLYAAAAIEFLCDGV